jgi:hypothetical protein
MKCKILEESAIFNAKHPIFRDIYRWNAYPENIYRIEFSGMDLILVDEVGNSYVGKYKDNFVDITIYHQHVDIDYCLPEIIVSELWERFDENIVDHFDVDLVYYNLPEAYMPEC